MKKLLTLFTLLLTVCSGAWAGVITWNTADNFANDDASIANGKNATFTGDDEATVLTYTYSNGCKRLKNNGGLSMNGKSQYGNSNNQRYFTFKAPSSTGKVSITFAAINGKTDGSSSQTADVTIYGGTTVSYTVTTLNSSLDSPTIYGLQAGTSDVIITFSAKCTIKEIKWTDVPVPTYTTVYANDFAASPMGAATIAYSAMSAVESDISNWIGWASSYTGGYYATTSSGKATLSFATPIELASNGTDRGRIRIYWGHTSNGKALSLKVNGSSVSFAPTSIATTLYPKMLNIAEYTIPDATETISSIEAASSSSSGLHLFRIEVLSYAAAPVTPTCATPNITVDNFNFEHKGYKVTITNKEGETLKVSTDGTNYEEQESPYVTYVTTTTHYYAKAQKASYDDSDVADLNVENTFDGAKKYIAWVYTDDYASKDNVYAKYHFNNDPMVTALQTNYNVVAVNYAADATPSDDLNNADLIVLTEAVSGSAAMTKAMKGFVGNVPMINMKFFAYTNENTRWQWGTPANPGTATTKITPNSKLYKVLNGVTFDGDDISLYSQISSTKNANGIQTVEWLAEPVNFVSSNTDMAVTDSKVSMHAGTKFFGIGLSCDSRSYYNENAFTIIKNAAAMLIAGEDLTTEVATVPVTIGASGYASYCSSYALDFTETGVTAYTAKVEEEKVVLTKVTDNIVPANEGVVLRGAQNDYDIPVATTDDSFDFSENQMVGVVQRTQVVWNVGGKYNYILQQGQFNMANGGYLKANRAYLSTTYNVEAQGGAKPLTIVFNDEEQGEETDGIKSVQGSGFTVNGEAYNLSGQRVGADYKGLVIVNGKKYLRK